MTRRLLLVLAALAVLAGCTIRDAPPATPKNLVCVEGHDVQLQNGDGKYTGGTDFVCTKYLPKSVPPTPSPTPTHPVPSPSPGASR